MLPRDGGFKEDVGLHGLDTLVDLIERDLTSNSKRVKLGRGRLKREIKHEYGDLKVGRKNQKLNSDVEPD